MGWAAPTGKGQLRAHRAWLQRGKIPKGPNLRDMPLNPTWTWPNPPMSQTPNQCQEPGYPIQADGQDIKAIRKVAKAVDPKKK